MALKLSLEETKKAHRKMWNWIANETSKRKRIIETKEYFEAHDITEIPIGMNYICDYSGGYRHGCGKTCIASWYIDENGHKYGCLLSTESPWYLYQTAKCNKDYKEAAKYAKKIAEI